MSFVIRVPVLLPWRAHTCWLQRGLRLLTLQLNAINARSPCHIMVLQVLMFVDSVQILRT